MIKIVAADLPIQRRIVVQIKGVRGKVTRIKDA
jgi:hypothetical protein